MLRSIKELEGYAIGAVDGAIGHVKDLYFDDEAWVIRYLIVETGPWLVGKKVLISPMAIGRPDWAGRLLPVSLTREQVKHSPATDTEKPVTRQHEVEYSRYYRYPYYWGGTDLWAGGCYPGMMLTEVGYAGSDEQYREALAHDSRAMPAPSDDPHLRSCAAVTGYRIGASDGEVGHVQGFLVDEDSWAVRYIVVDTSNWWVGHQVLVAPQWITDVSWADRVMTVDLSQAEIRNSPTFVSTDLVNREQETGLYDHYRRPGYWAAESARPRAAERR